MIVGTAFVEVKPDSKRFAADAEREVGGALGKVAKRAAAVFAGAFAVAKVKDFFSTAISGASDLNESLGKVNIVFGSSAKSVEKFASTAAKSLGQSRQQALEAAGTFGNLLRALELSEPAAAKMSTRFVGLATDLASFNNASPQEALDALRSGLTGETEPLKRFGVNLNEAMLKAEALALGISKGKDQLTPAQKAQAAYSLILKQTSLAQGDFARTSGGLANQQRILSARFEDLKTKVGQALLPVFTKVVEFFSEKVIPGVELLSKNLAEKLGPVLKDIVIPQVLQFADALRDNVTPAVAGLTAALAALTIIKISRVFVELAESLAAAGGLGAILTGPGAIVVGIAALAAGIVYAYQHSQTFRDVVAQVGQALKTAGLAIADAAMAVARFAQPVVDFVRDIAPQVAEAFSRIVNVVVDVSQRVFAALKLYWMPIIEFFKTFGPSILTILKGGLDAALDLFRTIFSALKAIVSTQLAIVADVIRGVLAVINGDWGKAWDALKDIPVRFFKTLGVLLGLAFNGIIDQIVGIGRSIVEGVWEGIKSAKDWFLNKAKGFFKAIVDTAIDVIKPGSPSKVFMDLGESIVLGLSEGIGVNAPLVDIAMKGLGDILTTSLDAPIEDLMGKVNTLFEQMEQSIQEHGQSIRSALTGAFDISEQSRFIEGTDILTDLQVKIDNIARFRDNLSSLRGSGVSELIIQQLLAAGPSAATFGLIDQLFAIVHGGQTGTLNARLGELQSQIESVVGFGVTPDRAIQAGLGALLGGNAGQILGAARGSLGALSGGVTVGEVRNYNLTINGSLDPNITEATIERTFQRMGVIAGV